MTCVVGVFASEKQRLLDRFSEASRYFESAFWYIALSAKRKRIALPVVEDHLDQLILNVILANRQDPRYRFDQLSPRVIGPERD
jgi:hypothetical protein